MKYEIEIPEGVIPEGYEPVAFRPATIIDTAIDDKGEMFSLCAWNNSPRLILRRVWQWPEWLDAERLECLEGAWMAWDGLARWGIRWDMTNHPEPPDKSRIYRNPKKGDE